MPNEANMKSHSEYWARGARACAGSSANIVYKLKSQVIIIELERLDNAGKHHEENSYRNVLNVFDIAPFACSRSRGGCGVGSRFRGKGNHYRI
jgi:hypothetical protein